ncbi:MAG: PD-(D/E)XK nuclease family protein [Clostridium sp.]
MMANGYEHRDYPEKAWSISRMKVIKSCLREYYYQYYASHNGWDYSSSYESKIAWRLKKLTNIWMLFGNKLHEGFKGTINFRDKKTAVKIDNEYVKSYVRKGLNKVVKGSIHKFSSGEWDEYPNGEMLQEYYYGDKLEACTIDEVKQRIEICVENFFNSKTYRDIFSKEEVKVLENDENTFNYFEEQGLKVFALIDTLYVDEMGNFIIVDWKTGNYNEEDKEQLLVYALYVMEKYKVPLDKIIGRVEYLLGGERDEYTFTNEQVDYIRNRIAQDINVINAFLIDVEENKPVGKEGFLKTEQNFKCKSCKFRRLCEEEEKDEANRCCSIE